MKYFKKMLEIAKRDYPEYLDYLLPAMPFVLMNGENLADKQIPDEQSSWEILALPFKICSFEFYKRPLFESDFKIWCIVAYETIITTSDVDFDSVEDIENIKSHEKKNTRDEVGDPYFFILTEDRKGNFLVNKLEHYPENESFNQEKMWLSLNEVISEFIEKLKVSEYGYADARDIVIYKDKNGTNKYHQISKVIYIRDKKKSATVEKLDRIVEWSHAFWVMGHWRKVTGIGKDRAGDYSTCGITWVNEHVRKSDLGDPIIKTRVRLIQEPPI